MNRKDMSSINSCHSSIPRDSSHYSEDSGNTTNRLELGDKCSERGYRDSGVFSGEISSGDIASGNEDSAFLSGESLRSAEHFGNSGALFNPKNRKEESNLVDSGFCSGSNIVSKEVLSADESSDIVESDYNKHSGPMRYDSGIGDSVSHQFSELNLKEKDSNNDLNNPPPTSSKCVNKSLTNVNKQEFYQKRQILVDQYYKQNDDGDTQLHIAIMHKYIEIIHALVRLVPSPKYLNIWNCDRQTALHLAVLTDQPHIVRLLVCAGASLDVLDRFGNTPLHLAVQADSMACVQCIVNPVTVEETSKFQLQYLPYQYHSKTSVANVYNYEGQTCVHLAAINGNIEILRHLLWYGADINAQEWKGGQTSLHIAVESRNSRLCDFLLTEAKINAEEVTYAGYTAYQTAGRGWDSDIADILQRHGVDTYLSSDSEPDTDSDDDMSASANGLASGVKASGGWINVGA